VRQPSLSCSGYKAGNRRLAVPARPCFLFLISALFVPLGTGCFVDTGGLTTDDAGPNVPDTGTVVPDGCIPAEEVCNGADDDCDGVIDNGFDLQSDTANCGTCGTTCAAAPNADAACSAGSCILTCVDGFADCDTDAGNGCEAELQVDDMHCGMCDNACGAVSGGSRSCSGGLCRLDCEATRGDCNGDPSDGCEVDLTENTENCGMCDNRCMDTPGASRECSGGMCSFPCLSGFADCDADIINGCEVTLATDVDHCGMCGVQCRGDNAVMGCADSDCEIRECLWTWSDCNGDVRDGCETRINSIYECGACETPCAGAAQYCEVTAATISCSPSSNISAVATGKKHGCALDDGGRVYCWGDNGFGQVADEPGHFGHGHDAEEPLFVEALAELMATEGATVTQIALGAEFSCALGSNGRVYCWGRNNTAQLGRGLLPPALASTSAPAAVDGLNDAIAIYAGGTRACAVRAGTDAAGSRVVCWGDGRFLGLGSTPTESCARDVACASRPIEVPSLVMSNTGLGPTSLAIGTNHACAVSRLNEVYCWGLNTRGQLGVMSMGRGDFRSPLRPFMSSVVSVSAGAEHTLVALTAATTPAGGGLPGNLMVFGRNNRNQLGLGPMFGGDSVRPSVISGLLVSRLGPGYGISAGKEHSCATTTAGLMCWGRDDKGQLGNAMFGDTSVPTLVVPPTGFVGGYTGLRSLATTEKSNCALTGARSVHCWGEGTEFRLGNGTTENRQTPTSVSGF